MRMRALRTVRIRQKESLLRLALTWRQLWEWQKEAIDSIPGNEGRIAQAWVNVRGGLRVFSVYFWHSEGWTSRNEALLEAVVRQAKVTRHLWLIVCDAITCPEDFEKSLWLQREQMYKVAPKEASTCMSLRVTASEVSFADRRRWKTSSRGRTKQYPLWSRETRRCKNGMSRRFLKRCLVTVEASCLGEEQNKEAEKKRRQRRNAGRETSQE